jgi:hypothetical protein
MQTFDPKKRATVEEVLEHPYLAAYHDAEDEPASEPLDPNYFEFDLVKEEISKPELKRATSAYSPLAFTLTCRLQSSSTRKSCLSSLPSNWSELIACCLFLWAFALCNLL